jgi:hypothetical protein
MCGRPRQSAAEKIESRSISRYRGADVNGNAARSCWLTHVAVGLAV